MEERNAAAVLSIVLALVLAVGIAPPVAAVDNDDFNDW